MQVIPLSIKEAEEYLKTHERHYKAPVEALVAIGVGEFVEGLDTRAEDWEHKSKKMKIVHGAAILGRRDEETAELAHIYCDGASQTYSLLYGACWRTLKALGYAKTVL